MKHVSTVLAILAALLLTDVHWCVMQSITWANMIGDSHQATLSEKVVEVLSGSNPCEHCDALQEGLDSDAEEVLEMITKMVTISPLSAGPVDLTRNSSLLFSLAIPQLRDSQWVNSGIEHPPRCS